MNARSAVRRFEATAGGAFSAASTPKLDPVKTLPHSAVSKLAPANRLPGVPSEYKVGGAAI